jgi:hypothetical protein
LGLSIFVNPVYPEATEVDGFCFAHRQLAGEVETFLPNQTKVNSACIPDPWKIP